MLNYRKRREWRQIKRYVTNDLNVILSNTESIIHHANIDHGRAAPSGVAADGDDDCGPRSASASCHGIKTTFVTGYDRSDNQLTDLVQ